MSVESRRAVVVGSTGLVGQALLKALVANNSFEKVTAISRRKIDTSSLGKTENLVVDLENATSLDPYFVGVTDLFFCLGTTLKTAGSKERFIEIEWGLSKKILEAASRAGVSSVFLVSAMGANNRSKILYNRVKGQIEELVQSLNFQNVVIVRPSLLLGHRNEVRVGESIAQAVTSKVTGLFVGPLLKAKPIRAELVAQRLSEAAMKMCNGKSVFENDKLHRGLS